MTDNLSKFIPITKVDAARREVWGRMASETPDATKEVCDYETSKPNFQDWSSSFEKITDGKSLGNVRSMHNKVAAGKLIAIDFNDVEKAIDVGAKIVDDNEWRKVEEGVYTGFSMGGSYANRWADPANPMLKRYTALPTEVSLADLPCIPDTTFTMIKADGTSELRKFVTVEGAETPPPAPAPADEEPVPDQGDVNTGGLPIPAGIADQFNSLSAKVDALMAHLIPKAPEPAPLAQAAATGDLAKTAAEPAAPPAEENPLSKVLDAQQEQLTKAMGTIATLQSEVEKLKGQLVPNGPILTREAAQAFYDPRSGGQIAGRVEKALGVDEGTPAVPDELGKIAALQELAKSTNDPTLRQALGKEIALLQVKTLQSGPPTLGFGA